MARPARQTKPMSLASLSQLWLIQKQAENEAYQARVQLEDQISHWLPGPEEGSVTETEGQYKITVTRKYTRALDLIAYEAVKAQLPSSIIRMKPELDLKVYRAIEMTDPNAFRLVQGFVSVKPAKTAVKIEVVE